MKLPNWIKIKDFNKDSYLETFNLVSKSRLHTVCVEANCPNRYECFSNKTATFMILGDTCTRNCKYCNIKKGIPNLVDKNEPERIAKAVKKLKLNYVVITSVTRDDLKDGGAGHFVKTVKEIRKINPKCKIELLISDLKGNWDSLKKIVDSKPDLVNHNVEVAKILFPKLRPKGSYKLSIELLKRAKKINPVITTKSGFMIGLGETKKQIIQTLKDLKEAQVDIVTIGQYLSPSSKHAKIKKFYNPKEFQEIKSIAKKIGLKKVIAGPLIRSSYNAGECFNEK
ncbi:MAG: lipoyl synthase [Candidatus Pacearchaeota archaeon]